MTYKNNEEQLNRVCKAYRELEGETKEFLIELVQLIQEEKLLQHKLNEKLKTKYPRAFKYLRRSKDFAPHRLNSVIKSLISKK